MPINIGITFLVGGTLGWIAAKLIKPKPQLEGLLIAMCSTGTYIYMLFMIHLELAIINFMGYVIYIYRKSGKYSVDNCACNMHGRWQPFWRT